MKFEIRRRKVAYHIDEICIDDHWFGIDDIIETLEAAKSDSIAVMRIWPKLWLQGRR